jgi:hypothetical protein
MLKRLLLVFGFLPLLAISSLEAGIMCPRHSEIPIRNVVFQNAALLSQRDQEEIASQIAAWYAAGGAIERVRREYEGRGYFRAKVGEEAVPLPGDRAKRYDIIVRVVDEGKQYRLGDLRFANTSAFSQVRLRRLFPIQRGDAFSWEKIYRGLDKLQRFYKSRGHVYASAVPTTELDDEKLTVNVQITLAEGERLQFQKTTAPVPEIPQRQPSANGFEMTIEDLFGAESWEQSPVKFGNVVQGANERQFDLESLYQTRWHPGGWVGSTLSPCLTPSFTCESDGAQAVCRVSE